jgi:hypothetical protein
VKSNGFARLPDHYAKTGGANGRALGQLWRRKSPKLQSPRTLKPASAPAVGRAGLDAGRTSRQIRSHPQIAIELSIDKRQHSNGID